MSLLRPDNVKQLNNSSWITKQIHLSGEPFINNMLILSQTKQQQKSICSTVTIVLKKPADLLVKI